MLVEMPRSNALVLGAVVMSVAFTLAGCGGRSFLPPPAVRYPAPAPVRSVDPGDRYAVALVAALASDPLVLHSVQTTKGTAAYDDLSKEVDTTVTIDLSGHDFHMQTVTKLPAGKTDTADLIVVGKSVYARLGSGRWSKSSRVDYERSRTDIVRTYQLVRNPAYLRYVGTETIENRKLHHIITIRDLPFTTMSGMTGTYTLFDIWVEEDGTPVLMKGTFTTVVEYGIEITGNTEIRISDFGGPIKIVAPKN